MKEGKQKKRYLSEASSMQTVAKETKQFEKLIKICYFSFQKKHFILSPKKLLHFVISTVLQRNDKIALDVKYVCVYFL